jgi:hypothetical protein
MSDLDNVVVVSFEDDSKPYQALSALKSLTDQGRLTVNSAAVAPCTSATDSTPKPAKPPRRAAT